MAAVRSLALLLVSATLWAQRPLPAPMVPGAPVAPAGTLSGTTLASNVVSSSLTSVGTLASLVATIITSSTAAAAQVGVLRLANTDQVCLRNSSASADICLTTVANGILGVSDGTVGGGQNALFASAYYSSTANRASAGQLRLASADTIKWRNNANGADQTLSKDSSDVLTYDGRVSATVHNTATNCSSSAAPAVCSAASAGSVVVAAGATTVVVNTTAVTANSQILVLYDSSLGTKLGVTCNVTEPALYGVTARTAATSFTITATAPVTNPACFSYLVIN